MENKPQIPEKMDKYIWVGYDSMGKIYNKSLEREKINEIIDYLEELKNE